jgi:hypothetical protein
MTSFTSAREEIDWGKEGFLGMVSGERRVSWDDNITVLFPRYSPSERLHPFWLLNPVPNEDFLPMQPDIADNVLTLLFLSNPH